MFKQTLCWDCAKACGGCSWSDHWKHSPVPGWKTEETTLRLNNDQYTKTHIVLECPEFVADGHGGGLYRIRSEDSDKDLPGVREDVRGPLAGVLGVQAGR